MGEKTIHVDYLIIGGGIAGCTLALELDRLNQSFLIIDNQFAASSSRVAAGLLSPMVPRNVRKTWMSDQLFPHVFEYYQQFELLWNTSLIDKINTLQIHKNLRQVHNWTIRAGEPGFESYLNINAPELPDCMKPLNFDCIEVLQTGRLNVQKFIELTKKTFSDSYMIDEFDHTELKQQESSWNYRGTEFKAVVFAEGIGILNNPYFKFLPFNPSGGDILKVKIDDIPTTHILKKKEWILPIGTNEWLAGSTYHPNDLNTTPLESDAKWLKEELESWIGQPIEILKHYRGVRPTVAERKPYIGEHPVLKGLFVYNGLGSKGSSLVSYFSPLLAQHLINNESMPEEVEILKYYQTHHSESSDVC